MDSNLLVAPRIDTHIYHEAAQRWFSRHPRDRFATCPVTQGTLLRVHPRLALDSSVDAAWEALREISEHPRHEFGQTIPLISTFLTNCCKGLRR
jgi:Predicted nucleic acid-binding protein, contains PIN domain